MLQNDRFIEARYTARSDDPRGRREGIAVKVEIKLTNKTNFEHALATDFFAFAEESEPQISAGLFADLKISIPSGICWLFRCDEQQTTTHTRARPPITKRKERGVRSDINKLAIHQVNRKVKDRESSATVVACDSGVRGGP